MNGGNMSKVMIVEDDNSLREIYSIRLTAEGYEVVAAADGEEALAMAVREKPNLILSDVMMPKISGFDMLDILRQTPETRDIKVIMMTALSSEDQRARGEGLGADKYLVKSQVGIEDVINSIHEVLGDKIAPTPSPVETISSIQSQPTAFNSEPTPAVAATPVSQPVASQPVLTTAPQPAAPVQPTVPPMAQPITAQPFQPIQTTPESQPNGINPAQ